MPTFIIEHLEPRLWKWCFLEYKHISQIVGKENVWFTNLPRGAKALEQFGRVVNKSVQNLTLPRVCVLDPAAKQELKPGDAALFDSFVFGGILGDDPPKARTGPELTAHLPGAQTRHLGDRQMSTDTAVIVTAEILQGKELKDFSFIEDPEIELYEGESTILPYRYLNDHGKPLISSELLGHLKRRKGL